MRSGQGVLRLAEDEIEDIELLRAIYELESVRASGPRSYATTLDDVAWTPQEVLRRADIEAEAKELESFVSELVDHDQAMRIPIDGTTRYVTRVAETIRLIGHGYEYWERSRPGFEAVRWLVERKTIPDRTVDPDDVISSTLDAVRGDEGDIPPNLPRALEEALDGVASTFGGVEDVRFSRFQSRAIRRLVSGQYTASAEEPNQILCADVGGGKTAAFAVGALVSAVEATMSDDLARTHLLLYPRTALARDQFKEVEAMASSIGLGRPDVHFEHYSYYDERNLSVRDGVAETYASPTETPDIIVTTLETLKRRLHNPDFVAAIAPGLRRVVLDEIHLVEGTTGTNVIRLLDRLRALAERDLLWTGASATIAQPDEHAAEVFGLNPDDVGVTAPAEEEVQDAGLVHHVFLKPTGQLSTLGLLTNTTSLVLHNRRDTMGDRIDNRARPKALGFADNLDLLGRWNSELRENERTEYQFKGREHPESPDKDGWGAKERELPYALRFRNPLTRRMRAASGQPADSDEGASYEPVLEDADVEDPCAACQRGERLTIGTVNPEELRDLGRFVYREPTKDRDNVSGFRIENEVFEADEPTEVGTLDRCPFMQAGACAWFPDEGFDTERIPGSGLHEWKHVARSTIHSSKKQDEASELQDELEEIVFEATVEDVYDIRYSDENPRVPVDIVLASPSLEVGIDLENVTEEVMHRSIRNVASYRQKAGRAGRELGSDTLITTVLSQRPVDLHYYRQPRKLVRTGRVEPVPLKEHNRTLLRSGLYMAVWDHLALHHDLPEVIPKGVPEEGKSAFRTRIEEVLDAIDGDKDRIRRHLRTFSRGQATEAEIDGAIRQVRDELRALVRPAPHIYSNPSISTAADLVANFIARRGIPLETSDEVSRELGRLKDASEDLREAKAKIHPRRYGMAEQVERVDDMRQAGWDLTTVRETQHELESILGDLEDPEERWELGEEYLPALRRVARLLERIESRMDLEEIELWQIRDQLQEEFASSKGRAHYLSWIIQDLPYFQHGKVEREYAFLPTLFKNPYEDSVTVKKEIQRGSDEETEYDSVPVDEALHSLIPGSWTYRMGKNPFKAEPGHLDLKQSQVALSRLDQMEDAGHRFRILKGEIDGPPWDPGPFDLYLPSRVVLRNDTKYREFERDSGLSADEVPGDLSRDRTKRSKLPKSYHDRWTSAEWETEDPIGILDVDLGSIEIRPEDGGERITGEDLLDEVHHPMEDGLISDIEFLQGLDVVEYIHGVSRSFGGDIPGLDISYRDGDRSIGFGNEFRTDGVLIELNADLVTDIREDLEEALLHDPEWAPSALKAVRSLLRMGPGFQDQDLDPWTIKDLVRVASASVIEGDDDEGEPTFRGLVDELERLVDNPDELERIARDVAEAEARRPPAEGPPPDDDPDAREDDAAHRLVERVIEGAEEIEGRLESLEEGVGRWVEIAVLNTFGITSVQALQRLSGTPEEKIGYHPRLEALDEGTYQVLLYDREMNGNGTCELLRDYTHILHLQRLSDDEDNPLLPTEDYLTLLEQELLQCPQHHTDVDALHRHGPGDGDGIPELTYVEAHAQEVEQVSRDVWEALDLRGPDEGWRLPVLNGISAYVAEELELAPDDVERATGICWNGCPECVLSDTMILGSLVGQDLVDKAILDRWFEDGRDRSGAYQDLHTDSLVRGEELTPIGAKTRVCRSMDGKTFRDVRLPFTIGASRPRSGGDGAGLLLRAGDIAGYDLLPDRAQGEAWGVSVGMPQLSGYLLLMSAYLGSLGRIPEDRREVTMVFYDIRDVDLDEAAFSQTMLDALESKRGEDNADREIRKLSDVLGWMAATGFDLTICVDSERAQEDAVSDFLRRVHERSGGEAEILSKDIRMGSMHAKSLLTPIGAVSGSANMTFSGTRRNDEVENYAEYGTSGYEELDQTVSDIIRGASTWNP
jgi:superfamily II DNA/RNA helicase